MSNIIFNFEKSGISEAVIDEHKKSLDPYREHMTDVVEQKDYSSLEASLVVPSDTEILKSVTDMIQKHVEIILNIFL